MPSRRRTGPTLLPPAVRRAAIRMTGDRLAEQTPQRRGDQKATKPGPKAVAAAGASASEAPDHRGPAPRRVVGRGASWRRLARTARGEGDAAGGCRGHRVAAPAGHRRRRRARGRRRRVPSRLPRARLGSTSRLPVELWSAHAPEEYVRSGLARRPRRRRWRGPGAGGRRAAVRRTRRLAGHARTGLRRTATRSWPATLFDASTARSATARGSTAGSSSTATGCAPGSRLARRLARPRRRRPARCPSRSWTTATPAGPARRPTSATTSRASPPSVTWCATRTSTSPARRISSTWWASCAAGSGRSGSWTASRRRAS